jgi:hypothetical protein
MTDPYQEILTLSRRVHEQEAMLDQLSQAAETLRDCWLERTGLAVEDDPYVEDACSTVQSVRTERLSLPGL